MIPHKDFEELKKQPVHFITGFNLAMESGDHHVRSTGFDAQNQETCLICQMILVSMLLQCCLILHMIFKKGVYTISGFMVK
mgnify:FL=1